MGDGVESCRPCPSTPLRGGMYLGMGEPEPRPGALTRPLSLYGESSGFHEAMRRGLNENSCASFALSMLCILAVMRAATWRVYSGPADRLDGAEVSRGL